MLNADRIYPHLLKEEPLDDPMGTHTGAGTIFGVTGGVMEAALRTAYYEVTGKDPDPDLFADIRTGPALRERTYTLGGADVHCAVVSGLGNARHLLEAIKAGKVHYDFVEVMACPGAAAAAVASRFPSMMKSEPKRAVKVSMPLIKNGPAPQSSQSSNRSPLCGISRQPPQ